MDFETARCIERILTTLFGGMSIFLGWNLFRVGIVDPQAGKLSGLGVGVTLQRVGPGVFFALFGSGILVVSLSRPATLRHDASPAGNVPPGGVPGNVDAPAQAQAEPSCTAVELKYALEQNGTYDLKVAKAIGSLVSWNESAKTEQPPPHVTDSIDALRAFRERMAVAKFGKDRYEAYTRHVNAEPGTLHPADKSGVSKVGPWLTGTLDDDADP